MNHPTHLILAISALACFSQQVIAKNIVFILADDLSPRLESYGGPIISPNLDRLADQGCLFEHANAQATICTPSRASIMTGMRPDKIGVRDNNYQRSFFRNHRPEIQTLPQYLQNFGYTSIGLGKTYGPEDPASWSRPDLGEADGQSQYALAANQEVFKNNFERDGWKGGWKKVGPLIESADVPDSAYPDGRVTDRAIELIRELKDKPFFLYLGYQRPHRPFTAPKKFFDLYENEPIPTFPTPDGIPEGAPEIAIKSHRKRAPLPREKLYDEEYTQLVGHYAAASYVDALVGQVVDALEELELDDETLVIFTADHGFHVGDNGQWDKLTLFEATCSVPLIIRAPCDSAQPVRISQAVELIDLYPTVLDFLELPHPPGLQGKSLMPQMKDNSVEGKDVAYTEVLRNAGGKISAMNWDGSIEGRSIRSGDYRLNRWWDAKTEKVIALELYDYSLSEPETKNLANDPAYTDVQTKLLAQLNEEWSLSN